ncbi:hypothetical protein [Mesorhizobium sp. STM 4661]|uniref:hypothetical protein n=1 Tax=Mesorhizobium sp. STM 4661 TaxID=1297570 RepID=UPI0005635338|nr:hypothetical protein [Mesorhizobium sp. STM 4661]
MTELLKDEVSAAASYLEACNILAEGKHHNSPKKPLFDLVGAHLTWGGKPLVEKIRCRSSWIGAHGAELRPSKIAMGQLRKSVAHRPQSVSEIFASPKEMMETLVYVEFEGLRFGPSRMRQAILDNTDKKDILWIRATNLTTLAPLIEGLGGPEWTDLGVVPPLKWEKGPKTAARKLQYLSPAGSVYRQYELIATYDTVVPTDEMFYVKQDSADFDLNGKTVSKKDLHNAINNLMKAGVIPRGEKVYLLNKAAQKVLDTVDMIDLSVFAKEKLADMVDATSLRLPDASWQARERVDKCQKVLSAEVPVPAEILSVCNLVVDDAAGPKATLASDSPLMEVYRRYYPAEYAAASSRADPVVQAYHEMLETYPLLNHTISYPTKFNHYMALLVNQCP